MAYVRHAGGVPALKTRLSVRCPKCDAAPGSRCKNLQYRYQDVYLNTPHHERRMKQKGKSVHGQEANQESA